VKLLLLLCLNACSAYDADLVRVEQGTCWCDDGEDTFQINVNVNGR